MIDSIKCDYIHSHEYRRFVSSLSEENIALSDGYWWVEKVNGSVGVAYHLFRNSDYMGFVRHEDLGNLDANEFLWRLMKYLEGYMKSPDWVIVVFPKNWNGTSWYAKSNEFVYMTGSRSKKEWLKFCKEEIGM